MRTRILYASTVAFLLAATIAAASVVITYNGYRGVTVNLEPIGLCGSTGDCTFMVTVSGVVLADNGDTKAFMKQFRSDDASYNLNATTTTNLYRKARRAWKKDALNEDTD